ncbi:MAG: outer membrane lipoprotein-sorting protein [Deltaproteobacteria bacterium]|jgi:outer membrane lipoprotein-sorting protein
MSSKIFGAAVALALLTPDAAWALDQKKVDAIVKELDDRQRNSGDYKALCYIEQKERGKNDLVYQGVFYRRDEDDKLMILFLKPKSEAGKGYLRLDKNMFMYDPTVGKWERRTERERIMGTDSRRQDFDESRLAEEFDAKFVKDDKLGKFAVHHLELKAKKGVDVAYPVLHMWIDAATGNMLKRQDFALSGRLMRTTYYPKWKKVFSESKGSEVYYPEQIRIFDEVEKGNKTTVVITSVDLKSLDANIFTKAWLESKSR